MIRVDRRHKGRVLLCCHVRLLAVQYQWRIQAGAHPARAPPYFTHWFHRPGAPPPPISQSFHKVLRKHNRLLSRIRHCNRWWGWRISDVDPVYWCVRYLMGNSYFRPAQSSKPFDTSAHWFEPVGNWENILYAEFASSCDLHGGRYSAIMYQKRFFNLLTRGQCMFMHFYFVSGPTEN